MIPDYLTGIYPNPIQYLYGKPVFVFRDHRWTLPIIYLAGIKDLLKLPIKIVTFDRHKDALAPLNSTENSINFRLNGGSFDELVHIIKNHLSPRNDDWIESGMELGLISDVVQFVSEQEKAESPEQISLYTDSMNMVHHIYHLSRPVQELSYKGALADPFHQFVSEGLWDVLGWDPSIPGLSGKAYSFIFDIDLDFFTFTWDKYIFAFTEEIYEGEFLLPCQSSFYEDYFPLGFIRELARKASLLTIACEPDFCGGNKKARNILEDINGLFLERELYMDRIEVDYKPVYPDE